MSLRQRVVLAVALCGALLAVAVGYVIVAGHRAPAVAGTSLDASPGPRILFRSTAAASYGRVSTVGVTGGTRTVSNVGCDRVYASAGSVICLRPDGPLATYQLAIMDEHLTVRDTYPLVGVPNRARVSPSGRVLAWTVFVTGDSYNGGKFSTRVGMLDVSTGATVDTLETWSVLVGSKPYQAADLNFWGVTFADDHRFYATMSTSGHRYLIAGDTQTRTVRTLAGNVECPSLSPDGTRLAFKEAIGGDPDRGWRLSVLSLATMTRTRLAETRSVDDQAAWLGNDRVMYAVRRGTRESDVYVVPADGSGTPSLLIPDASSPAAL